MASIELPALRTAFLLLSTLVAQGPPPTALAAGEPSRYLIENGTVQADIVLSTSPTRAARLAADELQLYLGKITGEQFDIVTAPGKPVHIFVGPSALAATYLDGNNQPITDAGLEHDSFRLVSGDGFLALIGRDRDFDHSSAENNPYSAPLLTDRWDPSDPASSWDQPVQQFWEGFTGEPWVNPIATPMYQHRDLYNTALDIWLSDEVGSLYAVHEFLRQLGVEWYLPGSLGEIVPELDTIEIPVVDRVFEPAIRDRRISFASFSLGGAKPKNDILWYYRIGLGDDPRFWVMHTLPLIHGHPDARIAYPEYFATISGVKDFDHNDVGTPLLTSDEFVAATVEYVKAYFDAYPYAQTFPVAPGDGFKSTCDDPECQALLTPERGRNGKLSDYVWQFVNRVATELAADPNYANKTIACFAYASYRFPPVGFDLADNVELMLAMPTRRLLSDAARDNVATLRQLWTDKVGGRRIHGWNYYNDSMVKRETFGVPMIHPRTIAADIREMAASYDTEFAEGLRYTPVAGEPTYDESSLLHPGLNHLNFWVTARAYWNPELDIDAELDLYLARFFGPAASSMRLFHDAVESGPWQSWSPTLIQAMLQHLSDAEQEALGADGGEPFRQRVAMIRAESEARLRQLLDVARAGYVRTILLESADDPVTFGAPLEGSFRNGFAQYFLADSLAGDERDPLFTTRFGVARSDSYLYLWSQSDEPAAVAAHPAALGDDDLAILEDDSVQFVLETTTGTRYLLAVNRDGHLIDATWSDEGALQTGWSSEAEVALGTFAEYLPRYLSIRIPLSSFDAAPPGGSASWKINVGRNVPTPEGITAFSALVASGHPTLLTPGLRRSARLADPSIFEDDFESGTDTNWSSTL